MVSMRIVVPVLCSMLVAAPLHCIAEEPAARNIVDCPNKPKAGAKPMDLNTATVRQIGQIPWVGNKTARAIVDRRKAVGEFKSMDQVSRVSGLGDKAYACLVLYVVVEGKGKTGAANTP
jgi:competence protein ComEA